MLKTRLFLALFLVIAMIAAACGFGIWLLRDYEKSFRKIVGRDFNALRVVNDFHVMATDLEKRFLLEIDEEGGFDPGERRALIRTRKKFDSHLVRLDSLIDGDRFNEAEMFAIEKLEDSTRRYLVQFDRILDSELANAPPDVREGVRDEILLASYDMADRVEEVLSLLEASVASTSENSSDRAERSARLFWAITIVAVTLTGFVCVVLTRQVIDPILGLTESIREVQQQNFERVLPVRSNDEIGRLAAAFNDMAAELRVMKLETDQEMVRLNRERGAIISGFPHPIFILDDKGEISQANPAGEALSRALNLPGKLPRKVEARVKRCLRNQEEFLPDDIDQAMLLRQNEVEVWYLPRIFRIFVQDEPAPESEYEATETEPEAGGWAVVLIDVTRVRWLDDMKSDLIGTVSHETKTPLTSIRMVLHLLAEQKTGELNETQLTLINSARDECERMLETMENLLQLSRIEGGHQSLDLEPVPPALLVQEAAESIKVKAREFDLKIETKVEEGLPPVLADRLRIGQVMGNLLSNAVKHSPFGENIVIAARQGRTDRVRFVVIDKGSGIPEAEQDRIFDRFYRAPGESELHDGSGLGLWISREIIRGHEGTIGVESESGNPTEFYFELPLSSS